MKLIINFAMLLALVISCAANSNAEATETEIINADRMYIIGGNGGIYCNLFVNNIVLDHNNNIYIAGLLPECEIIFNTGTEPTEYISFDNSEYRYGGFAAKYDSAGNCIWVTTWGARGFRITDMTVDHSNDIYLVGEFKDSIHFTSSSEILEIESQYLPTQFIIKISSDGDIQWYDSWQGSSFQRDLAPPPNHVVLADINNNVYVCGFFDYVRKYNASGELLWENNLGFEFLSADMDQEGNILINGMFECDHSWCVKPNYLEYLDVNKAHVLIKINSEGVLKWVKFWEVTSFSSQFIITVDQANMIWCILHTAGSIDLLANENFVDKALNNEIGRYALMKLDNNGDLLNITSWENPSCWFFDIETDECGNIYVIGEFQNEGDFNSSDENISVVGIGKFINKYSPDGDLLNGFNWNTDEVEGFMNEIGMFTSNCDEIYFTGEFISDIRYQELEIIKSQELTDDVGNAFIMKLVL